MAAGSVAAGSEVVGSEVAGCLVPGSLAVATHSRLWFVRRPAGVSPGRLSWLLGFRQRLSDAAEVHRLFFEPVRCVRRSVPEASMRHLQDGFLARTESHHELVPVALSKTPFFRRRCFRCQALAHLVFGQWRYRKRPGAATSSGCRRLAGPFLPPAGRSSDGAAWKLRPSADQLLPGTYSVAVGHRRRLALVVRRLRVLSRSDDPFEPDRARESAGRWNPAPSQSSP